MRERTDGDVVHAGLGDGADGRKVYPAARLGLAAAIDESRGLAELFRRHVVEEDDVRAGIGGLANLLERVGLHFNLELGKLFARSPNRSINVTGQRGEMVVLDEHHVEQAKAMVLSASATHGVFLELAPTRSRLAGIQNFGACSGNGIDKLSREGRDS